jgi:amino acid transporter
MSRSLRRSHLLAVGLNAIVGSSIFLIPGKLAGNLGWWSVPFFGVIGYLLHWIAQAFALLAKDIDRNGGPYTFANLAFNRHVAFGIGWLGFIAVLFGASTVGSALVYYFNFFCEIFGWQELSGVSSKLIISGLLLFFMWLNCRGTQFGGNAVALLTVLKIAPLVLLICGVAMFFPSHAVHVSATLPTLDLWPAISSGAVAVMFAYQGFEHVPVIAGEAHEPKKNIPWASVNSLRLSALLYMLVQTAVMCSSSAINSATPIVAASKEYFGVFGGLIVAVAGTYSIVGYLAGAALYGPRYLMPLAEDGFLPKWFAKIHPRYNTPYISIIIATFGIMLGCSYRGFDELLPIASLTTALQYFCSSVALYVLDRTQTARRTALISALISLVFIALVPPSDFIVVGIVMAVGFGIHFTCHFIYLLSNQRLSSLRKQT